MEFETQNFTTTKETRMIGLDAVFACVTYTAAVIATLQAGSRAKYLIEHNEIGVKKGTPVLPPTGNETSALWELAQVFQQSVELGLSYRRDPDEHGFVIQNSLEAKEEHEYDTDGYSLSPFPRPVSENEQLDKIVEMYIEDSGLSDDEGEEENPGRLSRITSLVWPSPYISNAKQSTKYWATRVWYWRKRQEDFEAMYYGESDHLDDDDLDLSLCISKKIRLPGSGGNNETQKVAQITAYAPKGFSKLRSIFRIAEADFLRSIFQSGPYISFSSNSKGAARVGGVFFFTRDGTYMIKTIKVSSLLFSISVILGDFHDNIPTDSVSFQKEEAETLIKMLPKYYKHMKRNQRHSLLTRFCGMYTVSIRDATSLAAFQNEQKYTFLIMNSVFPPKASDFLSETYDLKGSTVGRECSEEERQRKGREAVLKDLDLMREVQATRSIPNHHGEWNSLGYGLSIGATAKSNLLAQLRKDVNLLRECNVMDYSLLVGVVNLQPEQQVDAADVNMINLSQNQEKYYALRRTGEKPRKIFFTTMMTPLRAMLAPPLYMSRMLWSLIDRTMTSVLTYPLPYYDSTTCGVDGGVLSMMQGTKSGKRVLYYMGVIDFLQPWTPRKVAERKLKGIFGQDTSAISCVDPDEYATRFLDFIEAHVS